MALASGSITFKRLFVQGKTYQRVDGALLEKLAGRAIAADSLRMADATEIGWTTGQHVLDTDFDFGKNVIADGLYFALRIDTNRPPAELVRSYEKMSEQAMREASGRDLLSNPQRREARQQARAQADAQARSGAFRRMRQIPVFWDLPRRQIYLGGTGPTVVDHFRLLFRETFDRPVAAASSGEVAARWAGASGKARAFDDCQPAHFISPPDGAQIEAGTVHAHEGPGKDFLGTEWLTWLWYTSHVESPEIATPTADSITALFEKSLQLQCPFKIAGSTAVHADSPTRLPEAPVALAGGKLPIRAGLQIATRGDVFRFTVRGDVMNFSGVQLPPPEDAGSERLVFEDRVTRLRDLIDATEGMYVAFLKRRLSGKWPRTLSAMRTWIAAGRHSGYGAEEAIAAAAPAAS